MTMANLGSDLARDDKHGLAVDAKHLGRVIAELVSNGSIELSRRDYGAIAQAQDLLPFGTSVYLPAVPHQTLMSKLEHMHALRAAGYDPVPHIAARRIPSRQALRRFLDRAVQECGVHRLLLIGGDLSEPNGPYAESAALLRDGAIAEAGISEVGFSGYPEGHPRIPANVLRDALNDKLALAASQGLDTYVMTQFSFAPARIVDYCAVLAHSWPAVPVYVAMPGPTSPAKLIRYAKICGVSASLRALCDWGFKAAKLLSHTEPNEQLAVLARYYAARKACNIVGVHVLSFGGFLESAQWMHRMYTESDRSVPSQARAENAAGA